MPTVITKRNSLEDLSFQELEFIKHLISDDLWNPTNAARKAGYKSAGASAQQLMAKPAISKALGKEQRRRLERLELKGDEVLSHLTTALFFNPLSLFKPSKDGTWVIEDLDKIPDEIGRCIERIKLKSVESLDDDGNVVTSTTFEIFMMPKTKMLELAMKHCGLDGVTKVHHSGEVGHHVNLNVSNLLMEVEQDRSSQVIDSHVVNKKIEEQQNV